MKKRKEFSLFKRSVGRKTIWYYLAYTENGAPKRYSTGCTSKAAALDYCLQLARDNALIPREISDDKQTPGPMTFAEFAKDWWDWEKSWYIRERMQLGFKVGRTYADTNKMVVERYLLPAFGSCPLTAITALKIEKWAQGLAMKPRRSQAKDKNNRILPPLAPKSINNYTGTLSVMLGEAQRLGYIPENPCLRVRRLAKNTRTRGVLTEQEAARILSDRSLWEDDRAYVGSLLSAVTGMRMSEVRALRCRDVYSDHIHVEYSIEQKYGKKTTKTDDIRDLPIPDSVMNIVMELRGNDDSDRPVICTWDGRYVHNSFLIDGLRKALANMGMSEDQIRQRNITFHSWRHFLNTKLQAHKISEEMTQRITGHMTKEMTKHYTHFSLEDYRQILDVTAKLIRPVSV